MEKSRERTDLGNRGRGRNKEDGEAKGAQSALALRLGNSGVLVYHTTGCRPSVEEARRNAK